ncbi:MAG TPA: class I SAM-dependent methyltransferase [Candidatus Eisenbacteria bacterium]|nr:class I SAM-dependent methyltransferase [Candidatus Eisenbacteria bacterium]
MRDGNPQPYVFGHSEREIERLKVQARLIDPITRRFFAEAGIAPGMRVLDIGSGAGDVAFLAASMVGKEGEVVGVDRVPAALETARVRAAERSLGNVTFREGDPADLSFERPFDAVLGRYVLQFQPDPAAMLRKVARHVRPGGVVVFHEIDWGGLGSFPPAPTFERCCRWGVETLSRNGTETRMGMKLHAAFVAAGLPQPRMRLEALIGGADGSDVLRLVADLVATLLPEMERLGLTTAATVGVDTLVERMREEGAATSTVFVGQNQVAAWSRTQER